MTWTWTSSPTSSSTRTCKPWPATNPRALPSRDSLSQLLRSGIRVLLYAGDSDYVFSHAPIERLAGNLTWPGAPAFRTTPLSPLMELSSSRVVGEFRTSSLLSFVRISDAGGKVSTCPAG